MWGHLKRYHAHLIHRGAASKDWERFHEIRAVAWPWFVAFFSWWVLTLLADYLAVPGWAGLRTTVMLIFAGLILLGMTYAMTTYLSSALRSDTARRRRARMAETEIE